MLRKLLHKYREIISYLFWGVMTTIVSWGTYSLFVSIINIGTETINIALSNILSWICAVLFAFVTNKAFVFQSKSWRWSVMWPELWKFISARIVTGIIEIIAVPALVSLGLDQEIFGIAGSWSKVIVSVVVIILNYIFSKLFVFRKHGEQPADSE